jgi:REP element-mobilizing transposase RayT
MADTSFRQRKTLKHQIPFWVHDDSRHPAFFITINCKKRGLNHLAKATIWSGLLEAIQHREEQNILRCPVLVIMPDHLHAIMRFEGSARMPLAIRGLKRWLATNCQIEWQKGFFDHRLRSQESAAEKREYILQNPVRASLVKNSQDWPYLRDEVR